MQALELETKTDETGALRIQLSRQYKNRKFKVILLSADEEEEWLQAISKNPAFDFLKEPEEDIYSLKDGRPIDE